MEMGFWKTLKRPILALAPMANVTDAAFRWIIAKYSKWGGYDISDEKARPHFVQEGYAGQVVMFTEFVSADGLLSEGRDKLLVDLLYSESERPIVAQLFSGKPEKMYEAAQLVKELGFDGLDINMGCPDRSIEKSGAGAALIKNPGRAREIIRAAKRGADPLPVSIKTRLGYSIDILDDWLPELLAEQPAAITIHARARREMSKVPAHWDRVKRAVEIRDTLQSKTVILGNGDVMSIDEAHQKVKETGADGIMLGRAIFGNPWLFADGGNLPVRVRTQTGRSDLFPDSRSDLGEPLIQSRLRVMVEHTRLFAELLGKYKSFAIMKKHFKAYVQDFGGAKELRVKLMETENAREVEHVVEDLLERQDALPFAIHIPSCNRVDSDYH